MASRFNAIMSVTSPNANSALGRKETFELKIGPSCECTPNMNNSGSRPAPIRTPTRYRRTSRWMSRSRSRTASGGGACGPAGPERDADVEEPDDDCAVEEPVDADPVAEE